MKDTINKIILVGLVGRDPEVHGDTAHFSLATSRRVPVPDTGGFDQRTQWHRLQCSGRIARLAEEYIRKGDRLYVEGHLEYGSYERDGMVIPTADVMVRELVMMPRV